MNEKEKELLDKIRSVGVPLGEYVEGKIYYGIKTGLNKAFVIDEETKNRLIAEDPGSAEVIKPYIVGREIKRYQKITANKYLLFVPWHFPMHNDPNVEGASKNAEMSFLDKFPSIYQHLLTYKKELSNRNQEETNIRYEWYALQRFGSFNYNHFEESKIVYPEISQTGQFSFDRDGIFPDTTVYVIISDSKYLLGILNSKLITYVFRQISASIQGGFFRWKRIYIENLPIYTPNLTITENREKYGKIESIVTQILDLHKQIAAARLPQDKDLIQRQIDATDKAIDTLVYDLYGLTEEERKIIEESVG